MVERYNQTLKNMLPVQDLIGTSGFPICFSPARRCHRLRQVPHYLNCCMDIRWEGHWTSWNSTGNVQHQQVRKLSDILCKLGVPVLPEATVQYVFHVVQDEQVTQKFFPASTGEPSPLNLFWIENSLERHLVSPLSNNKEIKLMLELGIIEVSSS